jgi:hypothetical protein
MHLTSKPHLLKQTIKQSTLILLSLHHNSRWNLLRRLSRNLPNQKRKQCTQQYIPPRNIKPILLKHNQPTSFVNCKVRVAYVRFDW